MKTILEITKPKSNSFILWGHLIKSVVAFVGTFALLFFGPLMLGSRSHGVDAEDRLSFTLIRFIIEHPEFQIGISIFSVVITNIYLFIKNKRVKYIVKIEYNESDIRMELTDLYYSKKQEVVTPIKDFEFYIENTITKDNDKIQKFIFINKLENKILGEINPNYFFWSEHLIQLKNVLKELKKYRKDSVTIESNKPGLNSLTGWE